MRLENMVRRYAVIDQRDGWEAGHAQLTDAERAEWSHLRNPSRRRVWLAARQLGKQLIVDRVPGAPQDHGLIEILSRDFAAPHKSVRPTVSFSGKPQPWSLSISHTDESVLVALSTNPHVRVGVDLCRRSRVPDGFLQTWFTPAERANVRGEGFDGPMRLWAAKEALYKALNSGEGFAPHAIEVHWRDGGARCTYRNQLMDDAIGLETWNVDQHLAVLVTVNKFQEHRS